MTPTVLPSILDLHQVKKQFSAAVRPAVDGVSFLLSQGDILGLLGPSGCGKTTLLRLIAGFEQPQSGHIQVANQMVAGPNHWVPPEQRDIGLVFQDFALFPHLTVVANIGFGLRFGSRSASSSASSRVADVIALVGLQGLEHRYPHQLSGGQQQRVALARALAPSPALILLDEPLSNLDAQVRSYLREEIRRILKQTQTSAIFVTHDQEEALAISVWVAVMHQGQIEQLDRPEQVYQQPASRFVAEFVTQANFLPAQRHGSLWQTEVGSFPAFSSSDETWTGELMLRQEELRLQAATDGPVWIRDRQFLGRDYRYCLQTPSGQELHVRCNQSLPVGSRVQLGLDHPVSHIFPAEHQPQS